MGEEEQQDNPEAKLPKRECFALYGFELEILNDWRAEVHPKVTRKKGDVAFHSPLGNRFFVSWGPLEDATKRFNTLEEHREWNLDQIKKSPNLKEFNVSDQKVSIINGHRAISDQVKITLKQGLGGRNVKTEEMWSMRFYCPSTSRYYLLYAHLRDLQEFKDYGLVFNESISGFRCHSLLESS